MAHLLFIITSQAYGGGIAKGGGRAEIFDILIDCRTTTRRGPHSTGLCNLELDLFATVLPIEADA